MAGTFSWNNSAASYETNIALSEIVADDVIGTSASNNPGWSWDDIGGGPLVAGEPSALTNLNNATKQAKWSAAVLGPALNALQSTSKGKLFVCPLMFGFPTELSYVENSSGSYRPKRSLFQDIANGLYDQRYINLGKRTRLNMEAYGWANNLDLLMIRWNKEGDRNVRYGMPINMSDVNVRTDWLNAWARITSKFDYGYSNGAGDVKARHYYGLSRQGSGISDGRLIYKSGVWDGMEITMHPGLEMTTAVSGVTTADEAAYKAANWPKFIDGTFNNGRNYTEMVTLCNDNSIPFIVSECDPSHGASANVCWVPDWAGQWMFEQFVSWQNTLSSKSAFIFCMFDESNIALLTKSTNAATETAVKNHWGTDNYATVQSSGCVNRKIPTWYPGYTTTTPIPASNMTSICVEYARRHDLWARTTQVGGVYGHFKRLWGT